MKLPRRKFLYLAASAALLPAAFTYRIGSHSRFHFVNEDSQ
jgi:hypothetical protein